tara:strand:+ start:3429 stop:3569 length:141 start_codon:yes stop_codon:yes gene_type:complete
MDASINTMIGNDGEKHYFLRIDWDGHWSVMWIGYDPSEYLQLTSED